MKIQLSALAGAAALVAVMATSGPAVADTVEEDANGLEAIAVTQLNRLVTIDVNEGRQESSRLIQGLRIGEGIVGIDYRPANGELYAVTRGLFGTSRIVLIDDRSAVVRSSVTLKNTNGKAIRLRGSSFGVDFNPAADALRITSDAEQNLRANVQTGVATIDGTLRYAGGDPAAGRDPAIVGSAYTNGDQRPAGATSLYGLDAARDTLVSQSPPNDGVLTTVGRIPGLNVGTVTGFDISDTTDVGLVSTPSLLGTRLQVLSVQDAAPLLSRQVPLALITDIALLPGQ